MGAFSQDNGRGYDLKNSFLREDLPREFCGTNSIDSLSYARGLLCVVAALTVFGLTMLYSTSYNVAGVKYFQNQLMWVIIGGFGGTAAFFLGYRRLASWGIWLCVGVIILLLIARFFFPAINGANRWIRIPLGGTILSLQPSEFAKIALALFTAKYCSDNLKSFNNLWGRKGMMPLGIVICGVLGAILLGKDFGTTVLTGAMVVAILFAAGLYWRYLLIPFAFLVSASLIIFFKDPMRLARVTTFLQPEKLAQDSGYQLYTSLLALGSGNWFGIGFMESRMKARYLPEAHTDFILAIVGEELGVIALWGLIICYGIFCWLGLKISLKSNSRLGMLLGFGMTMVITMQAVINIAVVTGSAPTKGMPAPFISYGGTNMVICLVICGFLLSIATDAVHPNYQQSLWINIKSYLKNFLNH